MRPAAVAEDALRGVGLGGYGLGEEVRPGPCGWGAEVGYC